MAKATDHKIKMKSTASAYSKTTRKNKRNTPDKLKLMMYDPSVRKHVEFIEEKIKS